MKRSLKLCSVFLIFVASPLVSGLAAQTSSCTGQVMLWYPDPIPPGWDCSLPGEGPFSFLCNVPNANCPPVHWCPTCGKWVTTAGSPINLTNGNTYIQESDIRLPGLGGGLSLQRTWNSIWPTSASSIQVGIFGTNWRSTYEERVFTGSGTAANYMAYARSDGGIWYFSATSGSTWKLASPASLTATLTQNGTTSWTITFQNGEQRNFSYSSGSLNSITDRNGNTTQLTYDGSNRLVTVTDPASRHLYFNYPSGSSQIVSSVTTDFGVTVSYSYDTSNRLATVTLPDSATVTFTYNSQSLITSVTDMNGKVLESHTYDSHGRGLTSARANGVDAVTLSYPN